MSSYGEIWASQIASTMPLSTAMQVAANSNGNGTNLPVTGYCTAIVSTGLTDDKWLVFLIRNGNTPRCLELKAHEYEERAGS